MSAGSRWAGWAGWADVVGGASAVRDAVADVVEVATDEDGCGVRPEFGMWGLSCDDKLKLEKLFLHSKFSLHMSEMGGSQHLSQIDAHGLAPAEGAGGGG